MGGGYIDIVLFALLAGVLVYRLYVTLGQSPGQESDHSSSPSPLSGVSSEVNPDMQRRSVDIGGAASSGAEEESTERQRWYAGDTGMDGEVLRRIQEWDSAFDPAHFIQGARKAYAAIHRAFAAADRKVLQPLLVGKAAQAFEGALLEREKQDQTLESKLVSIESVRIIGVESETSETSEESEPKSGHKAALFLWVEFHTVQVVRLFDSDHRVISGEDDEEQSIRERWCFVPAEEGSAIPWKLSRTRTLTGDGSAC